MLRRYLVLFTCLAVLAATLPATAGAAVFQVTTTADGGGACSSGCTLRQAISAANIATGSNVVAVPAGDYSLTFGELQVQRDVTIEGAGPEATRVNANSLSRVFKIGTGVTAYIEGLAVEGGRVAGTSGNQAQGGGILNAGTLRLDEVLVQGNGVLAADNTGSSPEGGGVYSSGRLYLTDSIVAGNEATTLPFTGGTPSGAGIANQNGRVVAVDSTISANTATAQAIPQGAGLFSVGSSAHGASVELLDVDVEGNRVLDPVNGGIPNGGGIWAFGTDVSVVESTVSGNAVKGGAIAEGGGIFFVRGGDLTVERSLAAGNVAESSAVGEGGGIYANGVTNESLRIVNSTIADNRVTSPAGSLGGGVYHYGAAPLRVLASTIDANSVSGASGAKGGNVYDEGTSGSATILADSIVADGSGPAGTENCSGAGMLSLGHNIDSLDQCNFSATDDKPSTDPMLAALADNGGPTETQALPASSPAIDAGLDCPATDQRGIARPQGGGCDIGAFELVPAPVKRPATPAPPPAAVPVPPGLRLAAKAKIDLLSGKGALRAHCSAAPTDSCSVKLALLFKAGKKPIKVGAVTGRLSGGKAGKLSVKLTRKGLALLAEQPGQRLSVKAQGSSNDSSGTSLTVKATLILKGKAPSPHSK
jgi:CSLREA domain-containing protein